MPDDVTAPPPGEAAFSGLVLSLAAAALAYMGRELAPGDARVEPDLALARHTIDTIEMLKAKTAGNRTADEDRLVEQLLYQLRLAFVKAGEEVAAPPAGPGPAGSAPDDAAPAGDRPGKGADA